jgi:hypothetical protein
MIYCRDHVMQDLRLLNEAALVLLWRVDPAVAVAAPEWPSNLLYREHRAASKLMQSEHRAVSELMQALLLLLDQVNTIETVPMNMNPEVVKGRTRKTAYPLRYLQQDFIALERGLTELSVRLGRPECRSVGPAAPNRQLRWLAERLIARAEAILEAVKPPPTQANDGYFIRRVRR